MHYSNGYPKIVVIDGREIQHVILGMNQEELQIIEDPELLLQCVFEHVLYASAGPRAIEQASSSLAIDIVDSLLCDPVGEPYSQDLTTRLYHSVRDLVDTCTHAINTLGEPITTELPYAYSHRRRNNIVLQRTSA